MKYKNEKGVCPVVSSTLVKVWFDVIGETTSIQSAGNFVWGNDVPCNITEFEPVHKDGEPLDEKDIDWVDHSCDELATVMNKDKPAWESQTGGDHYKKMKIQPMEYSLANELDAGQHTTIKYVSRFKDKNGKEDLLKARHCIDMLIEFYYPED